MDSVSAVRTLSRQTGALVSLQDIRVASYTASKSGIMDLTRLLACEWAGKAINAVAPGYIGTNNTKALPADPDRTAQILGRIPAGH